MKLYIIILLNIFLFTQVFCETIKITIEEAITFTFKNNLDIKKENLSITGKTINAYSALNKFYPDISLSATSSSKQDLTTYKIENSLSAGINFSLTINAKMFFEIQQTIIDYQIGKVNFDKLKMTIEQNIKKSYFNIVLLNNEIKIKEQIFNNAKKRFDNAVIQFKNGEISELDKLNEELNYKTIAPELQQLKNDLINAINEFKIVLGFDIESELDLISPLPEVNEIDYSLINEELLNNNFDIKNITLLIEKDRNTRNINISSLTPSFRFSYSINASYLKDPYLDGNNWFENVKEDWSNSQAFSFTISVPLKSLLPFSGEQTTLINNGLDISIDKIDLKNEINKKKIELIKIILKLKEIYESFESLKFNVSIAEKVYKLTERAFYEGDRNALEVDDSEEKFQEAQLKLNKAFYDYYCFNIDLENLLNKNVTRAKNE